jgi:hypothetical protein
MRHFLPPRTNASQGTELALVLADGTSWRILMSHGTERFIGHYSRVAGFEAEGPVLSYRDVGIAEL